MDVDNSMETAARPFDNKALRSYYFLSANHLLTGRLFFLISRF